MTTPVDIAEVAEVVAAVGATSSSSPTWLVRLEADSFGVPKTSLEEGVSAPAAAAFCEPALPPSCPLASASCTALSSAALLTEGLVSVAAREQVAAGPARQKAASRAISDMYGAIRRMILDQFGTSEDSA